MNPGWDLDRHGFALHDNAIPLVQLEPLIQAVEGRSELHHDAPRRRRTSSVRNLTRHLPRVADLAASVSVRNLVEPILGSAALLVRSILFDKHPGANWGVAWHQDLAIAVRERREVPGFGPWTIKGGLHHVLAPAEILGTMLTVRIHLDPCGEANGALRVLPGSHRYGRLSDAELEHLRESGTPWICELPAGGVLLMRPLLLHASSPAKQPIRRRVIHLEFAAHPLPGGLEWAADTD
jgi:ectoine hydroxylase-related dioxygenase (phytanoyl-CoA dioxygenase family)